MKRALLMLMSILSPVAVSAAPVAYTIDSNHTHPLFEADHFGLSLWRGLFRKTTGTITLDTQAKTGAIEVAVELSSVDFANDKLNEFAVSPAPSIFDVARYPVARYQATLGDFVKEAPTTATGQLTLNGVTRPVSLHINSFKCIAHHPLLNREVCGADALGTLNRADFGITVGQQYGFDMTVTLRIQVEAVRAQ